MLPKDEVASIVVSDDAVAKVAVTATIEVRAKVILVKVGKEFVHFLLSSKEIYIVKVTIFQQLDLLFDRITKEFGRLNIASI